MVLPLTQNGMVELVKHLDFWDILDYDIILTIFVGLSCIKYISF